MARSHYPSLQYSITPSSPCATRVSYLLSHDHHHGLALALRCRKQALGRLKPMGVEGLRLRALEFCDFFAQRLTPHFRAEEEILFPFMRDTVPESAVMLDELAGDHESFRQASPKISGGDGSQQAAFRFGRSARTAHPEGRARALFPSSRNTLKAVKPRFFGRKLKGY